MHPVFVMLRTGYLNKMKSELLVGVELISLSRRLIQSSYNLNNYILLPLYIILHFFLRTLTYEKLLFSNENYQLHSYLTLN